MNPLETILGLLSELSGSEIDWLAGHIAQIRRSNRPVTDKPKRYPYVFECAGCKRLAHSERSDAITCSPACRVAAHRNGYAKALRDYAGQPWLDVSPALLLQVRAVEILLPDETQRIKNGEIVMDDIRGDIWRAYWDLFEKAMAAVQ